MRFLHFTRAWILKDVTDKHIYTINWEASHYWNAVQKGNFEIPPIEIKGPAHPVFLRVTENTQKQAKSFQKRKEQIFEEIRESEFPFRPSRKKCMFVFCPNVDYVKYARQLKFDLSKYNVIEIDSVEDQADFFVTDYCLLNCDFSPVNDIRMVARTYWSGKHEIDMNDIFSEVLFVGLFRITRSIHNID